MTSEERRQLLIVRQSQLERSIQYYELMGIKPTVVELFNTQDFFVDFIMNGMTPEIKERAKKMDKYISTKELLNVENHG